MSKYYLFLVLVLLSHLGLVCLGVLPGVFRHIALIDAAIGIIFFVSMLVAYSGIKADAESFVWRFLIMTTFQLLGTLTVIVVLFFKQKEQAMSIGLNGTAMALILLVVQSIFLFRAAKKQ